MTHSGPLLRSDEQSILLHSEVAERLQADPSILDRARSRVRSWLEDGSVHRYYVEAWERVLSQSVDEVAAFLVHTSEHACALRQVSPFAGVLDPRTRWRLLRRVRKNPAPGSR